MDMLYITGHVETSSSDIWLKENSPQGHEPMWVVASSVGLTIFRLLEKNASIESEDLKRQDVDVGLIQS